jgi:hypothetical protein
MRAAESRRIPFADSSIYIELRCSARGDVAESACPVSATRRDFATGVAVSITVRRQSQAAAV